MPVLWQKFSEDTNLPASLSAGQRGMLESLFDSRNPGSAWRQAIGDLGLGGLALGKPECGGASQPEKLIFWHGDTPYMNWSFIAALVSGGVIEAVSGDKGEIVYRPSYKPARLWSLIRAQWSVSRYINARLADGYPLPQGPQAQLRESLALGLAIMALMLRLPRHDEAQMASWLAIPDKAPLFVRKTVRQIQALQKRRTLLSPVWNDMFPDTGKHPVPGHTPAYFWDAPPAEASAGQNMRSAPAGIWKGLPVCPGIRSGRAVLLDNRKGDAGILGETPEEPLILVFPRARPDAVELYAHAAAVLFAEGGVLAHACVVAREYNLPCVTGLGVAFKNDLAALIAQGPVYLQIDGTTGQVRHEEPPL